MRDPVPRQAVPPLILYLHTVSRVRGALTAQVARMNVSLAEAEAEAGAEAEAEAGAGAEASGERFVALGARACTWSDLKRNTRVMMVMTRASGRGSPRQLSILFSRSTGLP